jgi:hypothetical protein
MLSDSETRAAEMEYAVVVGKSDCRLLGAQFDVLGFLCSLNNGRYFGWQPGPVGAYMSRYIRHPWGPRWRSKMPGPNGPQFEKLV